MADALDFEDAPAGDSGITERSRKRSEHIAEELFTTFMSDETAKQKYRDHQRNRGTDPQALKDIAAERLT